MDNTIRYIGLQVVEADVQLFYSECAEMELELFVVDAPQQPFFGHCCFSSRRMAEIQKKAIENGYMTYCRGYVGNETLYIRDSAKNVFEIKQLE